jgi:hypothetical protein
MRVAVGWHSQNSPNEASELHLHLIQAVGAYINGSNHSFIRASLADEAIQCAFVLFAPLDVDLKETKEPNSS